MKLRLDDGQIEVVDDEMTAIYRQKSPFERLQIAFGLWRSTRMQLMNCLRFLHPDWSERQLEQEVVRRISHGAV
jgi:hypothetical protein